MHTKATLGRPSVSVIARDQATLDGVASYLHGEGVATYTATTLDALRMAPHTVVVFVLFVDDAPWEVAVSALAELRERRSSALPVIVTSDPRRFETLTQGDRVLVVPRSVWGWSILDGICFHLAHAKRASEPVLPRASSGRY